MLSGARPDLAIRTSGGSVWRDAAGLGWTNPYDKRVWEYNVDVAVAAAKAGFDEIMFDYVRFPSDGDVDSAVYRNERSLAKRQAVPAFLRYAKSRLDPYGVRLSAAVFGLSAAPGSRHRPASPQDGAAPRHGVRDDLSVAVRRGRARAPGSEHRARSDRLAGAASLRARAPRPGRAGRARGCRTSASPSRTTSTRFARRSTRRGSRARRATCSGTPRVCTRTARSRRPRSYGARRSLRQPRPSRAYSTRSWSLSSRCVQSSIDSGTRR